MISYRNATNFVCDLIEEKIVNGELKFAEYTFADAVANDVPGIEWKHGKSGSYYQVAEPMAQMLISLAFKNHEFFDLCVNICCCNIGSSTGLPGPLQYFAVEVMTGRKKRPTPRNRPKQKNWLRDLYIIEIAKHLETTFRLTKTRNDVSHKTSVCDAIAEALTVCGCPTKYSQIKNLLTHGDKAGFREEVSIISEVSSRYKDVEIPMNWLRPETYQFYQEVADALVRDISATYPTK